MAKYSYSDLSEMTVVDLRELCMDLEIRGMSKKPKAIIIDSIMEVAGSKAKTKTSRLSSEISSLQSDLTSLKSGGKISNTITVSCGASRGDFAVVGKTVGAVGEFLREVLNVDRMSSGVVNGNQVEDSYTLQNYDILEFVKPAGSKG